MLYLAVHGKEFDQVHLCVLHNMEDARPYFAKHLEILRVENANKPTKSDKWPKDKQNKTFATSLKKRVSDELAIPGNKISEELRWISRCPKHQVPTFGAYMVDGVLFNTKELDGIRSVQNNGVFL